MEQALHTVVTPENAATSADAALCTAETAECTCPEFCERDHEND